MEKKRNVYAVIVDISNEAWVEMRTDRMGPGLLWGIYTTMQRAQAEAVKAEKLYKYKAIFSPVKVELNRVHMEVNIPKPWDK